MQSITHYVKWIQAGVSKGYEQQGDYIILSFIVTKTNIAWYEHQHAMTYRTWRGI
jgi:hypothetical protein